MNVISRVSSSLIIFTRYIYGLIFTPYKTIRKITDENDKMQLVIIFILVYFYFNYANIIRSRTIHPFIISAKTATNILIFIGTFILVTGFFYIYASFLFKKSQQYRSYLFSFAYSLLPTYIWFLTTSTLYLLIPPPRTTSFPGIALSGIFFVFSLTMFFWRINLLYLSIRFASKMSFYRIVTSLMFFSIWFIPYCYWLYRLRVFRIPFI